MRRIITIVGAVFCLVIGMAIGHRLDKPPAGSAPTGSPTKESGAPPLTTNLPNIFDDLIPAGSNRLRTDEEVGIASAQAAQIARLEDRLKAVENRASLLTLIDPKATSYEVVQTSVAPFLLLAKNAEPYLDGYRLSFSIGNVCSATFEGGTLDLFWGKGHTKHLEFLDTLAAGRWTDVQVILSPATSKDLSQLLARLDVARITLRSAPAIQP